MLVELYAGNYDIKDGLVNGANGILKAYANTNKTNIMWIQCNDINIGQNQSTKLGHLYNKNISKHWVPIQRIANPTSIQKNPSKLTIRKQFLVHLARAWTIHRSQGLTLDKLVFDPSKFNNHKLLYTTPSHVWDIQSLYLLSPLTKYNFKVQNKITNEMHWLQTTTNWKSH